MFNKIEEPIVIAKALRTPLGKFNGILKKYSAVDLGGIIIKELTKGINSSLIDSVVFGNVISSGLGLLPVKQAALKGGLRDRIFTKQINIACASGLEAVLQAVNSVRLKEQEVIIAGGIESRTNAPYLLEPLKKDGNRIDCEISAIRVISIEDNFSYKIKKKELTLREATNYDGLFWPQEKKMMQQYAFSFLKEKKYSLKEINEYALKSHKKAKLSWQKNLFKEEVISIDGILTDELLSEEEINNTLKNSNEIFTKVNTAVPADGAAAVIITTEEKASQLNLVPLAYIKGYSIYSTSCSNFLEAPIEAVKILKENLNLDFSIIEVNEAFGLQLPSFYREFKNMEINVHGGALALGHPLAVSGVRILVTLLYAMKRYNHKFGISTICFGGGGAYALAVERV